jgi:pantoate--beta-alanine ligase
MNADLIWAPDLATMYPDGFATRIVPEGAASVGLEDKFRPHFFSGVATVVGKLLIQCEPDFALFGEKDFQQLKVVTQMARDLGLKTKIVGVPIVREADGLALSSRNRYLSDAERAVAPALHRVLSECASAISTGKGITAALRHGREALTKTGFAVDYLEARDAETLMPVGTSTSGKIRLLVAARIGGTRLIDNVGV